VNTLKDENDQLIKNADDEIKRMSSFIEQYTKEFDVVKKEQEEEFEKKLMVEKKKNDELK